MGTAAGAERSHTDLQVCWGLSPLGLQAGCSVPLRLPRSSAEAGWGGRLPCQPLTHFPCSLCPPHTPAMGPLPPGALPDVPQTFTVLMPSLESILAEVPPLQMGIS